jgi:hypothetical protein
MIETAPGQRYTATVEGAPEGLEGTMGIRVERPDDTEIMARTTAGIVELVPGVYAREDLIAPATPGTYVVIWDNGDVPAGPEDFATEELQVTGVAPTVGGRGGVLPFKDVGSVLKQGGVVALARVACSVWPLTAPRTTDTGEVYSWTGEAELGAADELVGQTNRTLYVTEGAHAGRRLKVVGAARHEFLPHVTLAASEMRPGG